MTTGLDSPEEVYFFTRKPDQYVVPDWFSSEISNAQENTLENAKVNARRKARFEMVDFRKPEVDVQGKQYIYVLRSNDSREHFETVLSPECVAGAKGIGIRGLHYSAHEGYGDAIGITVQAESPEEAKQLFLTWYASIKEALAALSERFAILNKEIEKKVEELGARRLEEFERAKKAL